MNNFLFDPRVRLNASNVSNKYNTIQESITTGYGDLPTSAIPLNNAATNYLPGYTVSNARLLWLAADGGNWQVALNVTNLFSRSYLVGTVVAAPARPRTFFVTINDHSDTTRGHGKPVTGRVLAPA